MQDIEEIGEHVSSLIDTRKSNEINELFLGIGEKKKMKRSNKKAGKIRTKRMLKGVPVGLIVLFVASILVLGALLTVWTTQTGEQTGDISGSSGVTVPLIIDSEGISLESFVMPMDISTIEAGATVEYEHTFEVLSGDDKDVQFDDSALDFIISDVGYGFTLDVQDSGDVSVIDGNTYLESGSGAVTLTYVYSLDAEWIQSSEVIPYELGIAIIDHVDAIPVTVDDVATAPAHATEWLMTHPYENDYSIEGRALTIISVTPPGGVEAEVMDMGEADNNIRMRCDSPGVYVLTYTIQEMDAGLQTNTGTITFTVT